MAKYKFIKDKENPSDEEIQSKMNFSKVLQQGQQLHHLKNATRPAYKKPLFLGFMILIGVVCLMFILEENHTVEKNNTINSSVDSTKSIDTLSKK